MIKVPNQRLFSTKAASKYLGVHPDTLRKYADLGWIRARRLERRRGFALEDLNEFIDSLDDYQWPNNTVPGGKPDVKDRRYGN